MQPYPGRIVTIGRDRKSGGKHSCVIGKPIDVALILGFKFCKLAAHNLHRAMARLMLVVASPDVASQSCALRNTMTGPTQ